MDDGINEVGSAKFGSHFDLLDCYWQVPLSTTDDLRNDVMVFS